MTINRKKHDIPIRLVKVLNAVLMTLLFYIVWKVYYNPNLPHGLFDDFGSYTIAVLYLILYCFLGRTYDAFAVSYNRISEMVYSQSLTIFFSDVIMYIVICLLSRSIPWMLPGLLTLAAQIVVAVVWSALVHKWYFSSFPPRKTVIIYDMREGMEKLISEYGMENKFEIIGSCQVDDCIRGDMEILDQGVEAVFMCGVHSHERNIILKRCIEKNILMFVIPRIGDVIMSGAQTMHMFHLPMLRVGRYNPSPEFAFVKRAFDVLVSGIAIVLLSPILGITALAVKSDGGPAFYRQVRLTRNGRKFEILKFRSMRVDAEKDGVARLSTGDNDDRITKVGKVIRKVRLDELPQLFNIFIGDMSIVGPRPERPEIAEQYEAEMPEFKLRLQAKAGLTGYAQVYGKYNTTPYDKLQMDLMYIAHPSFLQDLKICFATIKILFLPESTEGVAVGATTAMDYENAADSTENDAETVTK